MIESSWRAVKLGGLYLLPCIPISVSVELRSGSIILAGAATNGTVLRTCQPVMDVVGGGTHLGCWCGFEGGDAHSSVHGR